MPHTSKRFLFRAVCEAIGELTGYLPDKIVGGHDLVDDLGLDSMASVSLLVAIEDRVGSSVPDGSEGRLAGVRTVGDLVERLESIYPVVQEEVSVDESAASGGAER